MAVVIPIPIIVAITRELEAKRSFPLRSDLLEQVRLRVFVQTSLNVKNSDIAKALKQAKHTFKIEQSPQLNVPIATKSVAVRPARKTKLLDNPRMVESFASINKSASTEYKHLAKAITQGSMPAAIELFCVQCVGGAGNVKGCEALACPLWPFRPYQV